MNYVTKCKYRCINVVGCHLKATWHAFLIDLKQVFYNKTRVLPSTTVMYIFALDLAAAILTLYLNAKESQNIFSMDQLLYKLPHMKPVTWGPKHTPLGIYHIQILSCLNPTWAKMVKPTITFFLFFLFWGYFSRVYF